MEVQNAIGCLGRSDLVFVNQSSQTLDIQLKVQRIVSQFDGGFGYERGGLALKVKPKTASLLTNFELQSLVEDQMKPHTVDILPQRVAGTEFAAEVASAVPCEIDFSGRPCIAIVILKKKRKERALIFLRDHPFTSYEEVETLVQRDMGAVPIKSISCQNVFRINRCELMNEFDRLLRRESSGELMIQEEFIHSFTGGSPIEHAVKLTKAGEPFTVFEKSEENSLIPQKLHQIYFGSSFFLFLGAYAQLNIIPYAMESFGVTSVQGGYFFLLIAFGIGTGAMAAGRISGKTVELGIVPTAAFAITLTLFGLDYFSGSWIIILPLILLTGFLGGMYQVPLDSYIQVASPDNYRGQVIAATNVLSFLGVLLASALLYVISGVLGLGADKGFTVLAIFAGLVALYFSFQFFDYVTRFFGMMISKLHFATTYEGSENTPNGPAFYVCEHTAWNDTLLLLGAQRMRMKFFIQHEQDHKGWVKKLYHPSGRLYHGS